LGYNNVPTLLGSFYGERKCADTVGTVLVSWWAGHFQF